MINNLICKNIYNLYIDLFLLLCILEYQLVNFSIKKSVLKIIY